MISNTYIKIINFKYIKHVQYYLKNLNSKLKREINNEIYHILRENALKHKMRFKLRILCALPQLPPLAQS